MEDGMPAVLLMNLRWWTLVRVALRRSVVVAAVAVLSLIHTVLPLPGWVV
jgi:hypothetical protein